MRENGNRLATFVRLPLYQNYLRGLDPMPLHISASSIAAALGFGEVQVRKDLAAVCGGGRPRVGYITKDLLLRLDTALSRRGTGEAVLVGAGKLGRALLDYDGFGSYGMEIVAAFDCCEQALGTTPAGKQVMTMKELPGFCAANGIYIGVLTVPAKEAQSSAEFLIASGIRAIWCFAPVRLELPEGILVRYENLAASLATLSGRLDKVQGQIGAVGGRPLV